MDIIFPDINKQPDSMKAAADAGRAPNEILGKGKMLL
jgi:hypothetical protein